MSLDIYLIGPPRTVDCQCDSCGHKHTREASDHLFSSNITHNVGQMAAKAGIYKPIWRPEEAGIQTASQLAAAIEPGIAHMKEVPEVYRMVEAANGWGTYDQFIPWLEELLAKCKEFPDATVNASR